MLRFSRNLKSTIVIGGFSAFAAVPAAAQGEPPAVPPDEGGDVAPAEVQLEEEGDAADEPATPPTQPPPPAAQPAAETDATATAGAEAGAAVTVGTDATATAEVAAAEEEEAVVLGTGETMASHAGVEVGTGDWEFGYHGFFRAPMRFGIGSRDLRPGQSSSDYSETTLHLPLVPDDQHLSWQRTNHSFTDWAEMFFSVGNPYARGTIAIEGYNFSQGSYSQPNQQFGISQGFIEIMPELPYENVRLKWKVGTAWGNYGKAGRYDAGEYDTYVFGRTKGAGEVLHVEIDLSGITLGVDHGIGTKRPDASVYNTARFTMLEHQHLFLETGGLMAGLHLLHAWAQEEDRDGTGEPGDMYYARWGSSDPGVHDGSYANWQLPDGSETIMGAEIKYDFGMGGLFYAGFAHMMAKNALTVAPAIEWMHAEGGGEFNLGVTNNYLDNPRCEGANLVGAGDPDNDLGDFGCSSRGTGNVSALSVQYEFSVTNLLQGLEDGTTFWGDGMDFNFRIYNMLSIVNSDYDATRDAYAVLDRDINDPGGEIPDYYSSHVKEKVGLDMVFSAFPALAFGARIDHLRPNNHLPEQNFTILSPRLIFRSRWVTREMITVQYSRYFYQQRLCSTIMPYNPANPIDDSVSTRVQFTGYPVDQRCVQMPSAPRQPEGWGSISQNGEHDDDRGQPVAGGNPNQVRPDLNVVQISAQMWW